MRLQMGNLSAFKEGKGIFNRFLYKNKGKGK
jgi:hypothetical protein